MEGIQAENYSAATLEVELNYTGSGAADNKMNDMFSLSNNPGDGNLRLHYSGAEPMDIKMYVVDALGQPVYHDHQQVTRYNSNLEIHMESHKSGMYYLVIQSGNKSTTIKLIKQ